MASANSIVLYVHLVRHCQLSTLARGLQCRRCGYRLPLAASEVRFVIWLIVRMVGLDALIEDVLSVQMCPKNILWLNSIFVDAGSEKALQVKYFRKFSTDFNQQDLNLKLITSPSFIEMKKMQLFIEVLKFSEKMQYFDVKFF